MAEKNLEGMDRRVLDHLLRHRTIKQDQVDAVIANLPDESAEAVECEVVFDDAVARSRKA